MATSACSSEKMTVIVSKRQKRREKSRDAARFRRHKESNTFDDICNAIPIPQDILNHLDKSAIMRLLISYIKLRQVMNEKKEEVVKKELVHKELLLREEDYVNSLNGFMLILSADLDVLYVSDNVKDYLGLSKFDLIGQSLLQYTHEGDHDDLKACFEQNSDHTSFFLRLKSTLTVNGKNINLKSASYKVLRCSGVVRPSSGDSSYLVAHAEPLPHPANIEHLLDSMTFVSQHSPNMKFTYCDEKFSSLLAYGEEDLLDRSYFDFCHVADMKSIKEYFDKLYRLNQVETNLYRFLAKTGGYVWMLTQATVITNQKNHKPQCIVCVHYVVSGLEHCNLPLSSEQLGNTRPLISVPSPLNTAVKTENEVEKLNEVAFDSDLSQYSSAVDDDCTFAPLTFDDLDENDAFLSEDLCYNAPSIGDPFVYSEDSNPSSVNDGNLPFAQLEDVFNEVRLDNSFSAKNTDTKCTYDPNTITDLPPLGSQPESTMMWSSPSGHNSGATSPCDSAYCGSPPSDPFSSYELPVTPDKPPERHLSVQGKKPVAWQLVYVPEDEYNRQIGHLKRGHVEGNDVFEWAKMDSAKRRCVNPNSNAVSKMKDWNPLKNPSILLQPGDSFGCEEGGRNFIDFGANFLLQPEANIKCKPGSQIPRNISSGFLPELTVRDCEVNAPLPVGGSVAPLGMDCVHLLDNET